MRRDRHVPSLYVARAGSMFISWLQGMQHKKHEEGRALPGYNYVKNYLFVYS